MDPMVKRQCYIQVTHDWFYPNWTADSQWWTWYGTTESIIHSNCQQDIQHDVYLVSFIAYRSWAVLLLKHSLLSSASVCVISNIIPSTWVECMHIAPPPAPRNTGTELNLVA